MIIMRKFFFIAILTLLSVVCFGQDGGVIKFLGIPIDGPEAEFANQLISKGFTYDAVSESYRGQFNEKTVDVVIHTNHDIVDRVYVAFPYTKKDAIKGEYNKLLRQFRNDAKYVDFSLNEEIPDKDDIPHEMSVNNKRYKASFSYYDADRDPVEMMNALLDKFTDFYTPEQLEKLKGYLAEAAAAPDDQKSAVKDKMFAAMRIMAFGGTPGSEPDADKAMKFLATFMEGLKSLEDGTVWFMIQENHGRYYIGLYYDNIHNQAQGEDL